MTEKQTNKHIMHRGAICVLLPAAFAAVALTGSLLAQTQQPSYPSFNMPAPALQLPPMPVTAPISPNGTVVEDVIARINDQVITLSEYEEAEKSLIEQAKRQNMSEDEYDQSQHNLLRDMIDQQILIAKGKELGVDGEAEMTRRLDEIRKQNHLPSMEALQKAAESQGISFEDFKQSLRNNAITQQVVRTEVGSHIDMTHAQETAFYDAHKNEFAVPEQVHLSEILIPTPENPTEAQITEAQTKADAVEAKLKAGASFAATAKTASGGPTALAGGDLGDFKRGTLGDVLEKATFSLPVGQFTAPIRTRQGFVILRVDSHQAAGTPPLDQVENQVEEGLYMQQLQPALRAYLTKMRGLVYYNVRPGFVDTGAPVHKSKDIFTAYHAPKPKKKNVKRRREEQVKAQQVQTELIAARQRVAQRNAEKAAAAEAGTSASAKATYKQMKRHKIRREKIRFGEAPRNSLPSAGSATETVDNGTLTGQAPGVAMSLAPSTTTITTSGISEDDGGDIMAIKAATPQKKTRFAQEESMQNTERLKHKLKKVEVKAQTRPVQATQQESASEKEQGAALGLQGDMKVKKAKKKHVKGEPKERYVEKNIKPEDTAPAPAPTANPDLVTSPLAPQQNTATSKTSTGSTAPAPKN